MEAQREPPPSSDGPVKLLHRIDLTVDTLCCSLSEEGDYLAVGCADRKIRVFLTELGTLVYVLDPGEQYGPVTCVKFRHHFPEQPGERHILLATYGEGYVVHWHVTKSQPGLVVKEDRQTFCVSYSPDMRHFATVGSDCYVTVYSEATGKQTHRFQASTNPSVMDGHQMRVFAVKYHPVMTNILLTGGWDGTVQFWDLRSEHAMKHISDVHVCGESIDIEPQRSNVLVGSWRRNDSLQIYDFDSCKLLKTFSDKGRQSQLYCAQWLDQGMVACGGGSENMARIVQRHNGQTQVRVTKLGNAVYGQDYRVLRSGRRLFCFISGTKVYVYHHSFSGLVEAEE